MYDDSKNILIIEDDQSYRDPLRDHLSARGYSISVADDGEMALSKLAVNHPNLIILDLLLPKISGFDFLKQIRENKDQVIASTPIVVLSNLSGQDDIAKAQGFKIDGYFVKSHTTYEQVLKKVEEILFHGGPVPKDEVLDFRS